MKKLIAHVVFSASWSNKHKKYFKEFIDILENKCGLKILYRWFENEDIKPYLAFNNSIKAIKESDVVIVQADVGSIGVGQQITYAIQQKKPVIICYKKSKQNMLFLRGTHSPYLFFVQYNNVSELKSKLLIKLKNSEGIKLEKFNFIATNKAKEILQNESRKRNLSQSELLRLIIEEWIDENLKS